jgi:hypothetical protein
LLYAATSWLFVCLLCATNNYDNKRLQSRVWLKKGRGDSLRREKCLGARDKGYVKVYYKVDSFVGPKRSIKTR